MSEPTPSERGFVTAHDAVLAFLSNAVVSNVVDGDRRALARPDFRFVLGLAVAAVVGGGV